MFNGKTVKNHPLAYCAPCSERTPHRYERLGVDGRLTSKAVCLVCNNDSRSEAVTRTAAGIVSVAMNISGFSARLAVGRNSVLPNVKSLDE